ncbi:acetyl-CoA carboxylase biotin carboxyl carrier protein [Lachnospiraceae bacterium 62-35]
MEVKDILKLMQAVSENGLTSFELDDGETKLSIKKKPDTPQNVAVKFDNSVPAMAAAMQAQAAGAMMAANAASGIPFAGVQTALSGVVPSAESGEEQTASGSGGTIPSDKVVSSPLVGTFYSSSSPGAEAFVKVGDTVKKGQVLGIIEAMKLMNEIESEYDGIVEAVLVENEEVVEYGQPLFRIR